MGKGKIIPSALLCIAYTTLPYLVLILSSYHYYYDYFVFKLITKDLDKSETYDFIVVGGGSSGSIIANRLSRNSKVLLLEAGGNPLYFNSIPAFASELLDNSQINWLQETVPQKHACFGLYNNVSKWAQGKLLGGSSGTNYMLHVRGNPLDYDNWANLTDDDGWNFKNVLPFFEKALNYGGIFSDSKRSKKNLISNQLGQGSVNVESNRWAPMYDILMDAGRELGYEVKNLNDAQTSGFGPFEMSQMNGRRHSTYDGFLAPVLHRNKLKISRFSQASKIKFDKHNKAIGVWYIRHGEKKFAHVSKEIILSGGAIGSPKILMLSGIGPKDHLESLRIKVKVNLPVGKNLQDHILTNLINVEIDEPISAMPERDLDSSVIANYFINGEGLLTNAAGVQGQVFISTDEVKKTGVDWPNIQIFLFGVGNFDKQAAEFSKKFNIRLDLLENFTKSTKGTDGFFFAPTLSRPKSVGEILLRDKNPASQPLIDPRYLEDPRDVKTMVEGVKFSLKIFENTTAFQNLNARLNNTPLPGCENEIFRSDKYWECYVRHLTLTVYHPSGTCRMGKDRSDPKAVVDSKLIVLGTIGLRVADASIMPNIVNGNTDAPCRMIGEKASDLIRDYWSQQYIICPRFNPLFDKDFLPNGSEMKCFYSKIV